MTPLTVPDADLLTRCRAGDERAWRVLYGEQSDRIARFARRMGARDEDIADVLQEVFVVVFRNIAEYDPARGALSTWIYGIALNVVRHQRRRSLRARVLAWIGLGDGAEPVADDDPEQAAGRAQALGEVQWVLDRMTPKLREVFVLYEIEGIDGPSVAAIVGCPEGTARSRLRLARDELYRLRRQIPRGRARGGRR